MIKILLFIYFLYSTLAFSNEENLNAIVKNVTGVINQLKDVGNINTKCNQNNINEIFTYDSKYDFGNSAIQCTNFLKKDGQLGNWGEDIKKAILNLPPSELNQTFLAKNLNSFSYICPNFEKFNDEQKIRFWVWSFGAIAHHESTCNTKAIAKGPNSNAVGLLQLEENLNLRKNRGSECKVTDILLPKNNLSCGVQILHQQLLGKKSNGELFWPNGYWKYLRLKNNSGSEYEKLISKSQSRNITKKDLKEKIMSFPYCR